MSDAFTATNKSDLDLSVNGQQRAVQLLLRPNKIESTLRYLGINVDAVMALT